MSLVFGETCKFC